MRSISSGEANAWCMVQHVPQRRHVMGWEEGASGREGWFADLSSVIKTIRGIMFLNHDSPARGGEKVYFFFGCAGLLGLPVTAGRAGPLCPMSGNSSLSEFHPVNGRPVPTASQPGRISGQNISIHYYYTLKLHKRNYCRVPIMTGRLCQGDIDMIHSGT
jgi:hypothetical protein